jgi:hypothetical protein
VTTVVTVRPKTRTQEAIQWTGKDNLEEVFGLLGWERPEDGFNPTVIHVWADEFGVLADPNDLDLIHQACLEIVPGYWFVKEGWVIRVMSDGEFQKTFEVVTTVEDLDSEAIV